VNAIGPRKLHCPECGQRLSLPTDDLTRAYRCPRCRTIHVAGDVIGKDVTLQAVPTVANVIDAIALEEPSHTPPPALVPIAARGPTPIQLKVVEDSVPETSRAVVAVAPILTGPATPEIAHASRAVQSLANDPVMGNAFAYPVPAQLPVPPLPVPPAPLPSAPPAVVHPLPAVPAAGSDLRLGSVTRWAVRFDAGIAKYRKPLWYVVLGFFVVSRALDALTEWGVFDLLSWILLVLASAVALLAKLDVFVGDDGAVALGLGVDRLVATTMARFRSDDEEEVPPTDWLRVGRGFGLSGGLFLLATEKIVVTFGAREGTPLFTVGLSLLGLAIILHVLIVRARAGGATPAIVRTTTAETQRTVVALPPVLTLSDRRVVDQAIAPLGTGLVREFLVLVARWSPRGCSYERDYKFKLLRRVLRSVPGVSAKTEYAVSRDGRVGRIDLVVAESLGVELKYNIAPSELRSALAQVDDYMQMWPDRPMFLLLCGRSFEPEHAKTYFGPEVLRRRAEGRALTVLILGA